jgi:type IV pilus assembly protein PilW
MINRHGFTLIELMITMTIMIIIIGLSGPVYQTILSSVKGNNIESEVYQDFVNNTDLIRLDIEHAGLGIARDETSLPIEWDEATKALQLRSVLNNTNQTTMGWALLDCTIANQTIPSSGTCTGAPYVVNQKKTPCLQSMVLLNSSKNFAKLVTPADLKCPAATGLFAAYPYDSTANDQCATGFCSRITYRLSAVNGTPASKTACAAGTYNLLREVGTNGVGGDTIMDCVADFRVRFDIDNDNNGVLDSKKASTLPAAASTGALMDQVKNFEIIFLVQVGQRDDKLNSNPNTLVSGVTLSLAGVTNATNYRWKVIKINGNPMSWQ